MATACLWCPRRKKCWITLNAVTLAEARKERDDYRAMLKSGKSPGLKNRKDEAKEIKRIFEKDMLPAAGRLAVADVRETPAAHGFRLLTFR